MWTDPFILAPLAGVTDSAYRRICRSFGCGMSVTEMVSAKGLHYNNENTEELLRIEPDEGPVGIQLFGSDPEILAEASKSLKDRPNVSIDINMGCPVPKVVKNGEGSALIKRPELAAEIVKAVSGAAGKPVTVKMRTGFDGSEDYVGFALKMQEAGAAAIAVHGRTREQYYSGKADRSKIKEIKQALDIPVIGNGDIFTAEDAFRMMDETGCDAVMIARGALGNPWIFRDCLKGKAEAVPVEELIQVIKDHFAMELEDKGERRAVREMRKHVSWYTKGTKGSAELRRRINTCESAEELIEIVDQIKEIKI